LLKKEVSLMNGICAKQEAKRLLTHKIHCVPIAPREKRPNASAGSDWPSWRLDKHSIDSAFNDNDGVGIILGDASPCIVDIDLDCEDAIEMAVDYLPATFTSGRTGAPGRHWWYRLETPLNGKPKKNYNDTENDGPKGLFEFRASDGLQTVVGPSVHPSGGVYDCVEPDQFAVLTQEELIEACEELHSAILGKRGHQPIPEPQYTPSELTVDMPGNLYNVAATPESVRELLEGNGYSWVHGSCDRDTYKHPTATKATSGFYRFDEKRYVNFSPNSLEGTGNGTARSYTPFSMYAILEHNGDFSAAARELVQNGYAGRMPSPDLTDIQRLISDFTARDTARKEQLMKPDDVKPFGGIPHEDVPNHLWDIPGRIGEACRWKLAKSQYYQPNFALFTTVAEMAGSMGPRFVTADCDSPNANLINPACFYLYMLGASSDGKGNYYDRTRSIYAAAGHRINEDLVTALRPWMNGFNLLPSEPDTLDPGTRNSLYIRDEGGDCWEEIKRNKTLQVIPGMLLKMWSGPLVRFVFRYSLVENSIAIEHPCPSILMFSETESFFAAMDRAFTSNGFVGRSHFIFGNEDPLINDTQSHAPVPQNVVDWHRTCGAYCGVGDLSGTVSINPKYMPLTAEALDVFQQYQRDNRNEAKELDGIAEAMKKRAAQYALRYALVHACSMTIDPSQNTRVDVDSVKWGIEVVDFVQRLNEMKSPLMRMGQADDRISDYCRRVLTYLAKNGGEMAEGKLKNRLNIESKWHMDNVRESLLDSGQIRIEKTKRHRNKWVLLELEF
jgi:hypothetical protein